MHEVKIRYTEPLVREAVRAFVLRTLFKRLGTGFFVAIALEATITIWLVSQGDRSWVVGVFGAAFIFVAFFPMVVYVAHYRNTIGKFRQMKVPEGTIIYNEEQFTLESELGSATLPWSAITEVWRYPRFWLILFGPAQFATLPLDCLDPATQAFIVRKTERTTGT